MPAEPALDDRGVVETDEGGQELATRAQLRSEGPKGLGAKELLREVGAVLRMSEAEAAELEALPGEDETMIINMGPQHPSTHGVLRLML